MTLALLKRSKSRNRLCLLPLDTAKLFESFSSSLLPYVPPQLLREFSLCISSIFLFQNFTEDGKANSLHLPY